MYSSSLGIPLLNCHHAHPGVATNQSLLAASAALSYIKDVHCSLCTTVSMKTQVLWIPMFLLFRASVTSGSHHVLLPFLISWPVWQCIWGYWTWQFAHKTSFGYKSLVRLLTISDLEFMSDYLHISMTSFELGFMSLLDRVCPRLCSLSQSIHGEERTIRYLYTEEIDHFRNWDVDSRHGCYQHCNVKVTYFDSVQSAIVFRDINGHKSNIQQDISSCWFPWAAFRDRPISKVRSFHTQVRWGSFVHVSNTSNVTEKDEIVLKEDYSWNRYKSWRSLFIFHGGGVAMAAARRVSRCSRTCCSFSARSCSSGCAYGEISQQIQQ